MNPRLTEHLSIRSITQRGKALVLEFLKEFFGQQDKFRWVENQEDTRIMIVDKNALSLQAVEKKPIVATSRGAMRWSNRTIGQFKAGLNSTGARKYMDLLNASVTIGCYAKHGMVAEDIADHVWSGFTYFRHVLRDRGFHEIQAMELGEEVGLKTDADQELSLVPINLAFSFTESWTLIPNAETLADIRDPAVISN